MFYAISFVLGVLVGSIFVSKVLPKAEAEVAKVEVAAKAVATDVKKV